jgi:hypothetical protein
LGDRNEATAFFWSTNGGVYYRLYSEENMWVNKRGRRRRRRKGRGRGKDSVKRIYEPKKESSLWKGR